MRQAKIFSGIPYSLFFGMLLLPLMPLQAQERAPDRVYQFNELPDRENMRSIPAEVMERYRNDSDFDYRFGYEQTISWWEQFKRWLSEKLSWLFGSVQIDFPIDWLLYIFCAAIIIFAILKLTGVSISGLFRRDERAGDIGMQQVTEQPIHEINFEEEISKAQQAQDYRKAIRLLYIFTLKRLADADLIHWHPGKTNADYQRELRSSPLLPNFRSLSIYYEYAWYGEFPVDARLYEQVNQLHRQISAKLSVKA
ncbi:MAG: DUF4129 domain-containing protein [Cyclobacteriaceae bacterium]